MKLLTLSLALLFLPLETSAAESSPVSEQGQFFKKKNKKKGFFKRIFKKKCKCPKVS